MTPAEPGRLWLVPNTLDHGTDPAPIRDVLADGVLSRAASITHWLVEDARSARAFLKRVGAEHALAKPLQEQSIVELPRPPKGLRGGEPAPAWNQLLAPALAGHDVGLLSEAGLPAVADPGAAVVSAAHRAGVEVRSLAGPSALLMALAASGLNGQSFAFVGYLPQAADARQQRLRELEALSRRQRQTQLFIETPYRNPVLVAAALSVLQGSTRLAVACGLTWPGGWTRCMSIDEWRQHVPVVPDRVPAVFALLAD